MTSEAQRKAQARYRAKNVRVLVEFTPSDTDIIEVFNKITVSRQAFIKQCIREYIANDSEVNCDF